MERRRQKKKNPFESRSDFDFAGRFLAEGGLHGATASERTKGKWWKRKREGARCMKVGGEIPIGYHRRPPTNCGGQRSCSKDQKKKVKHKKKKGKNDGGLPRTSHT